MLDARSAGIANLSLDLIFALPESVGRDFEADVRRLLALQPRPRIALRAHGRARDAAREVGRQRQRRRARRRKGTRLSSSLRIACSPTPASSTTKSRTTDCLATAHDTTRRTGRGCRTSGLGPAAHGFDGCGTPLERARVRAPGATSPSPARSGRGRRKRLTPENRIAEACISDCAATSASRLRPDERRLVAPWEVAGWVTMSPDGRLALHGTGLAAARRARRRLDAQPKSLAYLHL